MKSDDARKISDAPTIAAGGGSSSIGAAVARAAINAGAILEIGQIIAGRFQILEILGIGGMGAVYKAHDRDIDRIIALKCIRPELANNPEVVQRFNQELLLARQIAHRNVIRIYDVRDSGGLKFITMEYIDGYDLGRLMEERGKLPPAEAVAITSQVCAGLAAAHSEGVIHRDLKPSNIMVEKNGRVVVMDFGLARAEHQDMLTRTGAILGTFQYMSPEQARGEKLDPSSDTYAVGLILYEMLTGRRPYLEESAIASLMKRSQQRATPASDIDKGIPRQLSAIVSKCIEPERRKRYENAGELLTDLETFQPSLGKTSGIIVLPRPATSPIYRWLAMGLLALVVAVGGYVGWRKLTAPVSTSHAPMTVLVADVTNQTGDSAFDGTLEPMLNLALEGARFVNAYNRGDARRLAAKLPTPSEKLDEQSARLVAVSQGISTVVVGSLHTQGGGYELSLKAVDALTGKTLADVEGSASSKDEVLVAVPKLVAPIRKALGDATPASVQLAAYGPFTAASLEVVHQYGIAMELQFAGKMEDAFGAFSKAAELDPNFARAYSGMSATAVNLGRRQDAEKYIKLAMEHVDRMTERERYHTRAFYYVMIGDYQKCVDEYGSLVSQYPADRAGHNNLANCASELRQLPRAVEEMKRAVEISPKGAIQHMNLSVFASYSGDFKTGEQEARKVQELNPAYEKGYVALAFAQLGQGQLPQAAETYHQLEKVSARGASLAAMGLADLALYEGRFRDAKTLYEQGGSADLATKHGEAAAQKETALGYLMLWTHDKRAAISAADQALANSQSVRTRFLAGRIFAEVGDATKAQNLANGLVSELQAESQAYGKIIAGEIALNAKDSRKAIQLFTDANALLDTWIGRFDLGQAYLDAGAYAEADSEIDRCIRRRGESLALFLDEIPTYGYFPPTYYYQARTREGLKAGFVEPYQDYLKIRGKAGEDPILSQIHSLLGQ